MVKPELIFAVHPKIRWAGMLTRRAEILFAQMRPAITSLSDVQEDKLLLELRLSPLGDGGKTDPMERPSRIRHHRLREIPRVIHCIRQ